MPKKTMKFRSQMPPTHDQSSFWAASISGLKNRQDRTASSTKIVHSDATANCHGNRSVCLSSVLVMKIEDCYQSEWVDDSSILILWMACHY